MKIRISIFVCEGAHWSSHFLLNCQQEFSLVLLRLQQKDFLSLFEWRLVALGAVFFLSVCLACFMHSESQRKGCSYDYYDF